MASRSPASGMPLKPSTSAGLEGPALSTVAPVSEMSARTRPHSAPATTMSPQLERAALDQHGRDRTTATIKLGLDHGALGGPIRVGLEVENFGLQAESPRAACPG